MGSTLGEQRIRLGHIGRIVLRKGNSVDWVRSLTCRFECGIHLVDLAVSHPYDTRIGRNIYHSFSILYTVL